MATSATGTSSTGLVAAVSVQQMRAAATTIAARATPSVVDAGFAVSYVAIAALAALDNSGLLRKVREQVAVSDSSMFAVGKPVADAVSTASDLAAFAIAKRPADAVSLSDVIVIVKTSLRSFSDAVSVGSAATLLLSRPVTDSSAAVDVLTRAISKAVSDAVGINDGTDVGDGSTWQFAKTVNNVATPSDALAMAFSTAFVDAATAADLYTPSLDKPLADTLVAGDAAAVAVARPAADTVSVYDLLTQIFTKALTEVATVSSSGSLISQGYCDLTYFAEDYVGESRTFS